MLVPLSHPWKAQVGTAVDVGEVEVAEELEVLDDDVTGQTPLRLKKV